MSPRVEFGPDAYRGAGRFATRSGAAHFGEGSPALGVARQYRDQRSEKRCHYGGQKGANPDEIVVAMTRGLDETNDAA